MKNYRLNFFLSLCFIFNIVLINLFPFASETMLAQSRPTYDVTLDLYTKSILDSTAVPSRIEIYNAAGALVVSDTTDSLGHLLLNIKTAVDNNRDVDLPRDFLFSNNHPNPFNDITTFDTFSPEPFVLRVYNILGQKILQYEIAGGRYPIHLNLAGSADGIYFFQASSRTGKVLHSGKILKLKHAPTGSCLSPTAAAFSSAQSGRNPDQLVANKLHEKITALGLYDLVVKSIDPRHFNSRDTLNEVQANTSLTIYKVPFAEVTFLSPRDTTLVRMDSLLIAAKIQGYETVQSTLYLKSSKGDSLTLQSKTITLPCDLVTIIPVRDIPSANYKVGLSIEQTVDGETVRKDFPGAALMINNLYQVTIRTYYPDSTFAPVTVSISNETGTVATGETDSLGLPIELDVGKYLLTFSSPTTHPLTVNVTITKNDTTLDMVLKEIMQYTGPTTISTREGDNLTFPISQASSPTGIIGQKFIYSNGILIPVDENTLRVGDASAGRQNLQRVFSATHGTELMQNVDLNVIPTYLVDGKMLAMFNPTANNQVPGAVVKIGSIEDITDENGRYSIRMLSTGKYAVKITNPNFFTREKSINITADLYNQDERLVPTTFDMALFDTLTGRLNGGGTTRMMKSPRLYIINGPIPGCTGYETPTQQEIQEVINTWQQDIKQLSNGFIQVPDSLIYIGHDPNDPIFKQAVAQIFNGGATPNLTDTNKVWNLVNWNNTSLTGNGAHAEWIKDGVIVGARQRYRPGISSATIDEESMQSIGFLIDPKNRDLRYDYINLVYRPAIFQAGEFLYSRPPNNKSPDRNN